jgi:exodeoxyribonuclease V gamma subunit
LENLQSLLPPGFMVVHSNQPEALRDLVLAWIGRHPLPPLEDEQFLVQSNGVAQWLKLALAGDARDGGAGIAAGLQISLPSRFIWQAYRAVLGAEAVPATSPFDKNLLTWRLLRLLPELLCEDVFEPLRRFLADDDGLRKRHQLAERLADLFDQYQVYRADWLARWAQGEDVLVTSRHGVQPVAQAWLWQPRLWRALVESVGAPGATSSRADVHRSFLAAAQSWTDSRPAGLPQRLVVFGISSLPQQSLEVLAVLARWCQVLMCVHNPCEHDWSHVVADKDLLRAERLRQSRRPGGGGQIADDSLHLHAQPLLAAWGKQGRDFIRLLDMHDERERYESRFAEIGQRIDAFLPNTGATLLEQVQDDIRDLRPLAETLAHWPAIDARLDGSIRFHVSHSPQREVEVLHDQLLAALAADPTLRARDVIVMMPDIAAYAPHVQAVFGLADRDDPRHIPFTIADQGQRRHDPLLGAVEHLLRLPESRIAVTDVLDLLDVPAVRARFGIGEDELPLLLRWIEAAGVRWGLHAAHRGTLDLPGDLSGNTWLAGLRRMLLGYAVGSGAAWEGIVPMDEIGGLDAVLLGPLVRMIDAVERHWAALREAAAPQDWGTRLRALLADFVAPTERADDLTMARLETALQSWLDACAAAGLDEPLPLSVVRDHWLAQMDQSSLSSAFFGGAVTFATLMPMRAIPFRRVALLGMNGGDYPRSRPPMDFDLMVQDWRPGDRSRREDDRYLFLEALLSAREHLHVSWVGRSIVDNGERPPSVLVSQFRDHVAAGWRLEGAADDAATLLQALTIEHPLQPFNTAYFTTGADERLFSYAREWHAGTSEAVPALSAPLQPPARMPTPTLQTLGDFLRDPMRYFFERRLGVYFDGADAASVDHEPFALDALEHWKLQDELIGVQKTALESGGAREAALGARLEAMSMRDDLPVGGFGAAVQRELAEPMADLFDRYAQVLADWPERLPDTPVRHETEVDGVALRLDDWLGDLRRGAGGERARVLLVSTGLVKNNKYRRDKLLQWWVPHLAGHLEGRGLMTVLVSKVGTITLPPLAPEEARAHWDALLAAWCDSLRRPLPLVAATGFTWLERGGGGQGAVDAARKVYEGEREHNAYLARAFPEFDALLADGDFARLADQLLKPLFLALNNKPGADA